MSKINQYFTHPDIYKYSFGKEFEYIDKIQNYKEHEDFWKQDTIPWSTISLWYKLPLDFIKLYSEQLHWRWICEAQTLPENFIEKYIEKVDWENLSRYQKLSKEFIKKHKEHIDFELLNLK